MIDPPLSYLAYIYRNYILVIHNKTTPESTLEKNHNTIVYHFNLEEIVRSE